MPTGRTSAATGALVDMVGGLPIVVFTNGLASDGSLQRFSYAFCRTGGGAAVVEARFGAGATRGTARFGATTGSGAASIIIERRERLLGMRPFSTATSGRGATRGVLTFGAAGVTAGVPTLSALGTSVSGGGDLVRSR